MWENHATCKTHQNVSLWHSVSQYNVTIILNKNCLLSATLTLAFSRESPMRSHWALCPIWRILSLCLNVLAGVMVVVLVAKLHWHHPQSWIQKKFRFIGHDYLFLFTGVLFSWIYFVSFGTFHMDDWPGNACLFVGVEFDLINPIVLGIISIYTCLVSLDYERLCQCLWRYEFRPYDCKCDGIFWFMDAICKIQQQKNVFPPSLINTWRGQCLGKQRITP